MRILTGVRNSEKAPKKVRIQEHNDWNEKQTIEWITTK